MTPEVAHAVVRFVCALAQETRSPVADVIFHGGEPLLAPIEVWGILLEGLRQGLVGRDLHLSLQSNLWNLTDEHLDLLRRHDVRLGTSLDGPQALCDANRGVGYFDRTWASLRRANAAGMSVSAIATVTRQTAPYITEIMDFFREHGIPTVLHAAVAGMGQRDDTHALTVDEYADLITGLYPWYVAHRKDMRNDTLDHFVRCFVSGEASVCTFRDCLGMFLAISPTGDITSCQRLAGRSEHRLGTIYDNSSLQELLASPPALAQRARQKLVRIKCGACDFYALCKGGCYYNALAAHETVDGLCEAYRRIFSFVQTRLMEEMAAPANREEMLRHPFAQGKHPTLRKGAYISLGYEPHPAEVAAHARQALATYALGAFPTAETAAEWLLRAGVSRDFGQTREALEGMRARLSTSRGQRNNCYVHVTLRCNLQCTHCYADAGGSQEDMQASLVERIAEEAIAAGFRQLIITGGEPTVHAEWERLIRVFRRFKGRGTNLVLRTNLYGDFSDEKLVRLSQAFDQVVVSIDGNEATHDARRGAGSYAVTVGNVRRYVDLVGRSGGAELSLACVMPARDVNGAPGESLRALGRQLGIRRVRFRPLLPLGRAAHMEVPLMCEGIMEHESDEERLMRGVVPMATCGIGHNIFVRPDGRCYPCYAWCNEQVCLGNVSESLSDVLESEAYEALQACTVDTREMCRDCAFRYLCGGACRAWGNQSTRDVNASPADCAHLRERAQRLVEAACAYLELGTERMGALRTGIDGGEDI